MTDWDEIVENIRNAIEAVDDAHQASEKLRENTNHSTFQAFRQRMKELEEHLTKLKIVLEHEEAFAMDELMDALSKVYSGHRADHRRTPRMDG
jgi:dihydroorotase